MTCIIHQDQIRVRVRQLAGQIEIDYAMEPLCLVVVLKGGFVFAADLLRALRSPSVRVEFIHASSYGNGTESTGQVILNKHDLDFSVANEHVLLVDDIVDTGLTLRHLMRLFEQQQARSVEAAVLLDKLCPRRSQVRVKYTAFQVPDRFVVGYGLDHAQQYRGLPDIRVLEPDAV